MAPIRLGDLLVKAKVINESQLKAALAEQQKWGGKLGELLVRMRFVSEDMLVKALSKQMSVPAVNLESIQAIAPHVRAKIPADVARNLVVLPLQLRDEGKTLLVAMTEPQNLKQLDTLRSVSRCRIVPQLAGRQSIGRAFARFYEGELELADSDESFKQVDSQGLTINRSPKAPAQVPASPAPFQITAPAPLVESAKASKSPSEMLRSIEEAQRKEVGALKAMVEILIEKGVFTREEYLAKVKR